MAQQEKWRTLSDTGIGELGIIEEMSSTMGTLEQCTKTQHFLSHEPDSRAHLEHKRFKLAIENKKTH